MAVNVLGTWHVLLAAEAAGAGRVGVPKKTVYGCWRQWGLRGYPGGSVPAVPRAARGGMAADPGDMTMARIFKRCDCGDWDGCPHQWVVRYRTTGGRSSRQREQSFGDDLREAEDFALKVEHDKCARTFFDPKAGSINHEYAHFGQYRPLPGTRHVLRARPEHVRGRRRRVRARRCSQP